MGLVRKDGECALVYVEDEVEHARGNAEASEVEKLVVEWYGAGDV